MTCPNIMEFSIFFFLSVSENKMGAYVLDASDFIGLGCYECGSRLTKKRNKVYWHVGYDWGRIWFVCEILYSCESCPDVTVHFFQQASL